MNVNEILNPVDSLSEMNLLRIMLSDIWQTAYIYPHFFKNINIFQSQIRLFHELTLCTIFIALLKIFVFKSKRFYLNLKQSKFD